jgi:hypothetical protein
MDTFGNFLSALMEKCCSLGFRVCSLHIDVVVADSVDIIIILLIFRYRKLSMVYFSILVAVIAAQIGATLNGLIPENIFNYMFMSTSVVFSASKIPQILANFRNRSVCEKRK